MYFNESLEKLIYILNDSGGAEVVFASGESQARKIAELLRERLTSVEQVISAASPADLHSEVLRYEALIAEVGAEDVARDTVAVL